MLKLRKNKKGFTLVELIVVIAIMAVLAGTVAGVTVTQLNKQSNSSAKTELDGIAKDMGTFMLDYDFPAKIKAADDADDDYTNDETDAQYNERCAGLAVVAFIADVNSTAGPGTLALLGDAEFDTVPTDKDNVANKAGDHKFQCIIIACTANGTVDTDYADNNTEWKAVFFCAGKGGGADNIIQAEYVYSDVLAEN